MYSVRVNGIAVSIPLVTSAIHFFYPFNDTTYNVLLVEEVDEGNLGGVTEARRVTKRAQFARLCIAPNLPRAPSWHQRIDCASLY